jgi:hypothetical protein
MMKRLLVLAVLVAVLVAVLGVLASNASAAQITKIGYYQNSIDYYTDTPAAAGEYRVEIRWSDMAGVIPPDGSTGPGYPDSEVDVVVQGYDKVGSVYQPYVDLDVGDLYVGTNPQEGLVPITKTGGMVGKPIYFGVVGWIRDCKYRLRVWWTPDSTGVETLIIDTDNNTAYPGDQWAYGDGGTYDMRATSGSGHSVIQYWKGTLNRATSASDVWANWDDYNYGRDNSDLVMADNWQPSPTLDDMVSPLVTDTTIPGTGQYPALPGWYIAGPEIWTAAARPNVWGDILKDTYPKPGSLTWNAAPSWYTWSYPDTNVTTEKPTYFWGMVNIAAADGRSYSQSSQRSEVLTYKFYGPSFTWVYTTAAKAGISSVKVDTVEVAQVDMYSASTVNKVSREFSGFDPTAYHTVVIQNVSKNPDSTGTWTYHDAFIGLTDPADPVPTAKRQNNVDGSTAYDWGHLNILGTTLSTCKATSGSIAYTFNKTTGLNAFTWNYAKANKGGISTVYVDGKPLATVDLYAAATTLSQEVVNISAFANGWHTLFIVNTGKNPTSGGSWTYHDNFVFGTTTIEN